MIVSFSYPSTPLYGGGVVTLWEYANGLARRGHQVHVIHGPAIPDLITSPDQIDYFTFHPSIEHHVVAALDDPSLPDADVIFQPGCHPRMGQPAVLIQGYKLLSPAFERPAYRSECPKLCVASWLTEIGVKWGSPPEQLLHAPPGIDQKAFHLRTPVADRPIDVAMLYTDHPVKGGADGLEALELVRRQQPDLRVRLFGMLEPEEVPDWVELQVGADHETLATDIFGATRVFVQPSWREGFGLTAVEAMACGAALATTDNGGSRDYAFAGETAEVVPPRQPEAMAAAILRLLGDEDRRQHLALAGASYVERFNWDTAAEIFERHLLAYLEDPAALQHPPTDAPLYLEAGW